ncbi:RNA methyltransferase [Saccharothrix longispora]|uniref:TrmH family RNA methyltransferase n=1 Tax=Saccharothrix longispora TaxID=33920 RepID=UPI0028FD3EF7|nr:RNA methyltransferase [Saccharothrix longispora]MBY8847999.1 TrmH family RNA methyltransferase [Saccharothrix sp. MB29]MDU0289243.1 RNA methyltransferase [Saccharothrix longispora]
MSRVRLEGFHAVKHAVRFGAGVERVVVLDRDSAVRLARSHAPDLVAVLEAAEVVPVAEFERVVGRTHPTGVGGVAARPVGPEVRRDAPVVLLDNPRNLGNLGAVVRVAAGFGAGGVWSTGDVDPWHPTVVRAGAGLHFAVPVARLTGGVEDVDGQVVAFDAGGVDVRDFRVPDDAVLAFGSERHGLSDAVRGRADVVVSLPMRPGVSSYNLTTSVAMALYHWELFRRDRRDR